MKIDGDITFNIGDDFTRIELRDRKAKAVIARLKLDPTQLAQILSKLAHVECQIEIPSIDKLGKTMELSYFEFEMPYEIIDIDLDKLADYAQDKVDRTFIGDGWIAERYFSSQKSFFKQFEKDWARTTLRRWV